ncbi:MAG: hypothetical protein KC729_16680, partial [Candidatus Eisenbacteria bacterium]|nr:hypothetical protein [Candidatus Eisenbacteria bacterium]
MEMDEVTIREAHRAVFSMRDVLSAPFCDESWKIVLMPGDLLPWPEDFEALTTAAKLVGDTNFIVVDGESDPPIAPPLIAAWDYEEFADAVWRSLLSHKCTHIFGLSCEWGRAAWHDINIVGGNQTFMDCLIEASGGEAAMITRIKEA